MRTSTIAVPGTPKRRAIIIYCHRPGTANGAFRLALLYNGAEVRWLSSFVSENCRSLLAVRHSLNDPLGGIAFAPPIHMIADSSLAVRARPLPCPAKAVEASLVSFQL